MNKHPTLDEKGAVFRTVGGADYCRGVHDAIDIIIERGARIRGAIQPDRTVSEILARLIP